MTKSNIVVTDFLAGLTLFRDLSVTAISRLAAGTKLLDAPRGTMVCNRDQPCTRLHVVATGQVKLSLQSAQGEEKVVDLAGPGQSFGESALFLGKPALMCAQTLADSVLLQICRHTILTEIANDSRFALNIIAILSQRLHALTEHLEGCTLRSGTQRVIGYLLQQLPAAPDETALTLPARKGVIASQLNLTQEHFSRILHDLMTRGIIEVNGRDVRVHDPDRLRGEFA